MKTPILAVVGPTASGKTELAVSLALEYNGEVISADSMQIYKEYSIATAKPDRAEMRGVPHHLMNILSADESFSAAEFVRRAKQVITEIRERGKLPVIAGGTGLYVSSLLNGIEFPEAKSDPSLRDELRRKAEEYGAEALLDELRGFDPEAAERLHPGNVGRIIRAVEIYRLTGITMTEQLRRSRQKPSPYEALVIGLNYRSRAVLYDRINKRVDIMLKNGLLDEVKLSMKHSAGTAAQAIGHKELIPYIRGEIPLDEALEALKRETRRYAKRQLTWFNRVENIHWIYRDEEPESDPFPRAKNIIEKSALYGIM